LRALRGKPPRGARSRLLVLRGRRAHYRITDPQPVFYTSYSASELQLVRLKPGESEDDQNLKISSSGGAFRGATQRRGIRAEDRVDLEAERDAQGWYRLKPRTPLAAGEYGLALTPGFAGGGTTGRIYDFGVD
jgi:hypothetical protein